MIGVSCGLAAAGKVAFCSTFGVFMPGRCFDQIRVSVAQTGLNVKMVSSHGGISIGEDGISAMAIEDLALVSSLPGITVIVPADVVEARQAIEAAARTPGPFYIRTGRPTAIIAKTVKGKGVSFMENDPSWHGKAPSAEQMEQALAEIGE